MTLPARFDEAHRFATNAHEGQIRKFTDDPYIVHPVRTAVAALRYGLPDALVNAMLLHDVVEDCGVDIDWIETTFGRAVSDIVWGLSDAEARIGAKTVLGWNRARRKEYWWFVLFKAVLLFALGFVLGLIGATENAFTLLSSLYNLAALLTSLAVLTLGGAG